MLLANRRTFSANGRLVTAKALLDCCLTREAASTWNTIRLGEANYARNLLIEHDLSENQYPLFRIVL